MKIIQSYTQAKLTLSLRPAYFWISQQADNPYKALNAKNQQVKLVKEPALNFGQEDPSQSQLSGDGKHLL